jgi:hypothetical protein
VRSTVRPKLLAQSRVGGEPLNGFHQTPCIFRFDENPRLRSIHDFPRLPIHG